MVAGAFGAILLAAGRGVAAAGAQMFEGSILHAFQHWLASPNVADLARRALVAALIVGAAYLLARLLRLGFDRMRRRFVQGSAFIYIVEQIGGYLILFFGLVAAVAALGVNLTSVTIFGGAVGVGVGLGLQGVVKEFISGIVLIFDPNIQVGDFVEVGEIRGEVMEFGARATRLRTNDDLNVVIPNSVLMQSRVVNWTYNETSRRIHVPFSVAEESDTAQVREVALAAAKALAFTLPDDDLRKTQVWLTGFGGAGLDFDLVVWPSPESSRHPRTMHAAYTWAIHAALRKAGIKSANNQVDVRLQSLFGREGEAAIGALTIPRPPPHVAPAEGGAKAHPAPNDAAQAMLDDADRDRLSREEAPRSRERRDAS